MPAKEQRGLRDAISSRLCIRAEATHIITLPPQLETDQCLSDVEPISESILPVSHTHTHTDSLLLPAWPGPARPVTPQLSAAIAVLWELLISIHT